MPEPQTIGELAAEVRAKNAGPFWITIDVFLESDEDYELLVESGVISKESIAALYQVPPAAVEIFEIAELRVIKISFPRSVTAGGFQDRDQHAGQQYLPLARLPILRVNRVAPASVG